MICQHEGASRARIYGMEFAFDDEGTDWTIGDQLRLILPISGGHSSNLPMRVLCPSILLYCTVLYPSIRDIRLLYLQVGAVRLLYPSAEDIRLLYLQVVAASVIDLQYCT